MAPGTYLEKRRLMAGYSLTSLAREVLMLTGFGACRAESDFRRLRMTLISAEQGSLHHTRERIDVIRTFVPLDPQIYFHLVAMAESGEIYRVSGLCQNCGCSFRDPCTIHVGPAAPLGTSTCRMTSVNLCSACETETSRVTPPRLKQVVAALRAQDERGADRPIIRLVPKTGEN